VVGEPGHPKEKGAKTTGRTAAPIDYRAIPAGSVTKNDAFGAWEAELQKFGFAIIHNKIVVIDPFSENCAVVTGSHNLGFRASHNNDENLVIVRGHRGLAEAYACHVLDIYDHYAWRYWLAKDPQDFGRPLEADDTWQERYIQGPDVKAPELRFWLAAAGAGIAGAAPKSRSSAGTSTPARTGGGAGQTKRTPAKPARGRKPAKAKAAKPRTPKPKSKPTSKPKSKRKSARKAPTKKRTPARKGSKARGAAGRSKGRRR
jgi:hypothetical protein